MLKWVRIKEREKTTWVQFLADCHQLLDAAIASDGSPKGNIQLFNPNVSALQIVAQRGFDIAFLQQFEFVRFDEPSACGRAFRLGRRVMIPDIHKDRVYMPYLSIAQSSGYRAVQSTPIIRSDGVVIGVLSTHFAQTHEWSDAAQRALDNYADQMAALVAGLAENLH